MSSTSRTVVLNLFGSLAALAAQTPIVVSTTGYITDTFCGRKGATALHVECAKRNVASGKAKYALYDEASKKLYILDPQQTAEQYLGQRVTVTGTVSSTPLTRAGQSYAPDAATGQMKVHQHAKALDSTTPVAGVLNVLTIAPAPK